MTQKMHDYITIYLPATIGNEWENEENMVTIEHTKIQTISRALFRRRQ